MSRSMKKYRIFLDVICVILALLPIVSFLLIQSRSPIVRGADIDAYIHESTTIFRISDDCYNFMRSVISKFGLGINSGLGYMCATVMSNFIMIYMCRVVIEFAVFLPKLFLKWMEDKS